MEWTFNNRPPSVFCLILKSQNLTETLQIEIRDIMIALPLKAYTDCIWCNVCVYAQNCCFICGRAPVITQSVAHISSHINLLLPAEMWVGDRQESGPILAINGLELQMPTPVGDTLFRMPAKLLLQLILDARRLKFAGGSSEILITQKL